MVCAIYIIIEWNNTFICNYIYSNYKIVNIFYVCYVFTTNIFMLLYAITIEIIQCYIIKKRKMKYIYLYFIIEHGCPTFLKQ